jgi:hypothetical protein
LEKYIKGSFSGIFNQKTTVNLKSNFVVFGIKNLEEVLRPVAMQIILDYIWTIVKKDLRKRILIVDEAWYMMKYPDSAEFLRGIVKRGRKYYLGVTTITQDVDDFLKTEFGKEIVTNSSIQVLLKQHSAAIEQIGEVFFLSEGEKQLLLTADKGEGIFFAGQNHVAIRIIASEEENSLITSNPEELMRLKKQREEIKSQIKPPVVPNPVASKIEAKKMEMPKEPELPTLKPSALNLPPAAAGTLFDKEGGEQKPEEEVVIPVRAPGVSLDDKIKELETREKASLDTFHQEKNAQEKVKVEQEKSINDLLKKLEGLPPLPKTPNGNKPLFMNQQPEPKIPQPPQFQKKPIPVFKSPSPAEQGPSPLTQPKAGEAKGELNQTKLVPLAKIALVKKPVDLNTGKVVELPIKSPSLLNPSVTADAVTSPLDRGETQKQPEEKKDEALSIGLQPVPPVQPVKEEKAKI